MVTFIFGVLVGVIIGFVICAICVAAGNSDRNDTQCNEETGESDAADQ